MIIYVALLTDDRKVKTNVIPFSIIDNVSFEFETIDDESKEEMIVNINSNNRDITISNYDAADIIIRIIGADGVMSESKSIKDFEKQFIRAMAKYVTESCITKKTEN